jgi:hypothetical protein
VIAEPLAAESRLVEAVRLDLRAHRPVENEDAAVEKVAKFLRAIRLCHSKISRKNKKPRG